MKMVVSRQNDPFYLGKRGMTLLPLCLQAGKTLCAGD